MTDDPRKWSIDPATRSDIAAVADLFRDAFAIYVDRIGREPAPMQIDVPAMIDNGDVYVLREGGEVKGAVHVSLQTGALQIDEVAVAPAHQGRGYGRALLEQAEKIATARELRTLTLYTNEAMHENLRLYSRIGYVECGRKQTDGFDRVYFRKDLPAPAAR